MKVSLFQIALVGSVVAHLVIAAIWPRLSDTSRERPPVKISMAEVPPPPPPPEPEPEQQEPRAAPTPTPRTAPSEPLQETSEEADDEAYEFDSDPMPQLPDLSQPPASTPGAKPAPKRGKKTKAALHKERDDARRKYVAMLQSRVASQQRYPYAARRMGLSGVVPVSFRIGANGSVSSINAGGNAASVLRNAAKKAVRQAAPFPPPPAKHFPDGLTVNLPLSFRLQPK